MNENVSVLFAPLAKRNPYQRYLALGLKNHGVDVVNFKQNYDYSIDTLRAQVKRKESNIPDILHLHWTHPYMKPNKGINSLLFGIRFLQKIAELKSSGIKIVWTVHNLKSHENVFPALELFFLGKLTKQSDALLVHCNSSKRIVSKVYRLNSVTNRKIFVVPHANYIGCYPNSITRIQARQKLGFSQNDRVLLFLGQIRAYKGLGRLIKEFKSLGDNTVKLVVAGKPISDQVSLDLKNLVAGDDRISLHANYIPDNEIQTYMNASDAVVLPFTDILTSGSALLAMSFRKPIIAPKIGCIPELLGHQGPFLYDAKDDEGLISSLKSFSGFDAGKLQKIGIDNYRHIENLTWAKMAEETCHVYDHVLAPSTNFR